MRLIAICLAALLILVQYPLWLGKGGWLKVWDMTQQVDVAHQKVSDLKARNAKLNSEVLDLKDGTGAIEERARTELSMIKKDEIFVQILDPNNVESVSAAELQEAQRLSAKVDAAVQPKPVMKPDYKVTNKTAVKGVIQPATK
ncbi:MAG: cell division protein FtsB [Glaciimonas sp.]|nr:cell division protein FtsB [Glaciimonas sp.]